ncbi:MULTISPECIES: hypothetical protein [unclassified Rhizobium]|uniref:hypothetical protein n=1 Tax=unclassified Rhizobium TaxID=2613769 RepID=UPI0016183E57|nr:MULTISPECIES: hypothetical protein [unclassified Rhizobium]MBB3317506.1 hypothetical protein [Rhizobium sp. BK181]MBB3543244.1 hypothetical protein [Rhizobium sp. BK399]MCS3741744.1 hypothetical protein [Rhizobium sp. BK661]MCS4093529.1 hypothetical protein [Rhizobium sp. BK176]
MTASPRWPKVQKGGIVAFQPPDPLPIVVAFQYNPDEVTRQIAGRSASGGGRGDARRLNGPPDETLTFSVEIDAADQLEKPGQNGVTVANGLHPALAALEKLVYPAYSMVLANEVIALAGGAFILAENAPMAFLVWGAHRVLPVRLESLSVREEAFDQSLNPIRARADLTLKVLTYRDLSIVDPGYFVYLAALTQKQAMAAQETFGARSGLQALVP